MTKDRIIKRTKYWKNRLGLINWNIKIKFGNITTYRTEGNDMISLAQTVSDPIYKDATITYHSKNINFIGDDTIMHELVHVLLSPIYTFTQENVKMDLLRQVDDLNEIVTSEVTNIILRLIDEKK